MEYAIDTQILTRPNSGDIIRELAFTALSDDSLPIVLYFKPSTPWRKDNYNLADLRFKFCRHGFSRSNDVVYDFTQIGKILHVALKDATRLVVIGEDKNCGLNVLILMLWISFMSTIHFSTILNMWLYVSTMDYTKLIVPCTM